MGLAGVILVTGITPFAVQAMGAAAIPCLIGIQIIALVVCLCMGALAALTLHDVPARTRCLDAFYRRHESDPLVIDKWFALQASIPEPGTVGRVQALTSHPAFSFANPNRIRALIGSFAQGNQTQFHRADGAGYAFVAQTVVNLDAKNPQVAARLLSAFKSWRALEPTRERSVP